MLHRDFDSNKIYKSFATYNTWKTRANTARAALCCWYETPLNKRLTEKPPFQSALYGELKEFLQQYFNKKCAYCEARFAHVAWGDVEHYRPKRKVFEDKTHPGYYWLTYDEQNLLPSCQLCNQADGKLNQFPLRNAKRACSPIDPIEREEPLLLNPYNPAHADMSKHIEYVFEEVWDSLSGRLKLVPTGVVRGITLEGIRSVEVYNLNRADLVTDRRDHQQAVINGLLAAYNHIGEWDREIDQCLDPASEYATAVRATCKEFIAFKKREVALLESRLVSRSAAAEQPEGIKAEISAATTN